MPIATFLPGATYSSGVYTIPYTALNTALTTSITAADDTAHFLYALLEGLNEKINNGTISQVSLAAEVANKSVQGGGIWETAANTFTSKNLVNYLVSFPFDTVALESGANITAL